MHRLNRLALALVVAPIIALAIPFAIPALSQTLYEQIPVLDAGVVMVDTLTPHDGGLTINGTAVITGNAAVAGLCSAGALDAGSASIDGLVTSQGFSLLSSTTALAPVVTSTTAQQAIETGTRVIDGGTATVAFSPSFGTAPVCTCTDTSATAAAVGCSATNTILTVSGTLNDTASWVCIGSK